MRKKKKKNEKKSKEVEPQPLTIPQKKLFYHVKHGNLGRTKHYVEKENIDVNIVDKDGWNPLHHAANLNNEVITAFFLENQKCKKNAQVKKKGEFKGFTALHFACFHNHENVTNLLIGYGCDATIKNSEKKTPRQLANKKLRKIIDNQKQLMSTYRKKRNARKEVLRKKKEQEMIDKEVDSFTSLLENQMNKEKGKGKEGNLDQAINNVLLNKVTAETAKKEDTKDKINQYEAIIEELRMKNQDLTNKLNNANSNSPLPGSLPSSLPSTNGENSVNVTLSLDNDIENDINEFLKGTKVLNKLIKMIEVKEYTKAYEERCSGVLKKIQAKSEEIIKNLNTHFQTKIQQCLLVMNKKRKEKRDSGSIPPNTNLNFDNNNNMGNFSSVPSSFGGGNQSNVYSNEDIMKSMSMGNSNPPKTKVNTPQMYICPMSGNIMNDPVTLVESGTDYERSAIEAYLRTNSTDPITGMTLYSKEIKTNVALRVLIQEFQTS